MRTNLKKNKMSSKFKLKVYKIKFKMNKTVQKQLKKITQFNYLKNKVLLLQSKIIQQIWKKKIKRNKIYQMKLNNN